MYQIIRAVNGCFGNVKQAFAVLDQKVRTGHFKSTIVGRFFYPSKGNVMT